MVCSDSVVPSGLSNAAATLNHKMRVLLKDLKDILTVWLTMDIDSFIDDILIISET